jgi:hypothetical protein
MPSYKLSWLALDGEREFSFERNQVGMENRVLSLLATGVKVVRVLRLKDNFVFSYRA